MDAISLYQNGVRNVAASLGTALTDNQAKLINRYTKNVVLSYDADAAGQKAALRGIEVLRNEGCKVKVLHVTDGKDPDEYIKKNGRDAFDKLVEKAIPYTDYKIEAAKRDIDLGTEEGKIDFIRRITPILSDLTPVEADIYIKKAARDTGISEKAIKMEIPVNNKREQSSGAVRQEKQGTNGISVSNIEASVLKCLFIDPQLSEALLPYMDMFESELSRRAVNIAFEEYGLKGDFDKRTIMDRLDPDESMALQESIDKVQIKGNEKEVLTRCIHRWEYGRLEKEEKKIIDMLTLADADKNEPAARDLAEKLMRIRAEMEIHGGKI